MGISVSLFYWRDLLTIIKEGVNLNENPMTAMRVPLEGFPNRGKYLASHRLADSKCDGVHCFNEV